MKKLTVYWYLLPMLFLISCNGSNKDYTFDKGSVFGTYYSITYQHPKGESLQMKIEQKFKEFDNSLSTFNPESIISRINRNDEEVLTDNYFDTMYHTARLISEQSEGAFDITVGPLVSAWGFGFSANSHENEPDVAEILPYIGYRMISLENGRIIKEDDRNMLDASAIAKGQSCDVIAELLESHGCQNYMVEIGGEVVTKGLNPKGEKWKIAIDKPQDDPDFAEVEFQTILGISNVGLATSGNYRQFYFRDGKKYAHTIDPRTGYPVNHNLLSATVIAESAMQADAYATAFMVLGLEKSLELCRQIDKLECYLIYEDEYGLIQTQNTDGFNQFFLEE